MRRSSVNLSPMAAALACALLLTSCSTNEPQASATDDGIKLVTYADMTKDYVDSQADYLLPAAATYPDISTFNLYSDGTFQDGFGEGRAVYIWNCAWASEYLKQEDKSSESALHALEVYASMEKMDPYINDWDDQSMKIPFVAMVEGARLGDSSGIQRDTDINCPGGDPRR